MRVPSLRIVVLVAALAVTSACGGEDIELCEGCAPTPTVTSTPMATSTAATPTSTAATPTSTPPTPTGTTPTPAPTATSS